MSHLYFDRKGKPITLEEWSRLFEDWNYKRIMESRLPDGKWISTVWLGLDHGIDESNPIIFETMVFEFKTDKKLGESLDTDRYSTEQEARRGHKRMFQKYCPHWKKLKRA